MTVGVRGMLIRLLSQREAAVLTLAGFFDLHYYPFACTTKRRPRLDRIIFDKHFRDGLGRKPLGAITSADLQAWVVEHAARGYKPGTINKHIFLLNRLLRLAREWGMLEGAGSGRLGVRRLPAGEWRQRFASEAELAALLGACAAENHPFLGFFVRLLILTGARSSEARLARWRDFDLPRRLWTVPVSKNGRARRIVLSSAVMALLPEIRARALALGLAAGPDDPIFTNPRTRRAYNGFHLAWDRARERAGLGTLRLHDLRHTFASLLINNGATIYEVQKLLGHQNITMTERYAHLVPDTLQRRVEIIPDAMARAAAG